MIPTNPPNQIPPQPDRFDQLNPMYEKITIDLDYEFEGFKKHILPDYKKEFLGRLMSRYSVRRVFIRASSRGNTHMRIELSRPVNFLESLVIRAVMCDDTARIACDLDRYFEFGNDDQTNRCFDDKIIEGEKRSAGTWEAILF